VTRSLRTKLPAVIAALFVIWALRGGRPEVVHARAPESPEIAPLVSCYHNLLRMWAEL